MKFESSTLVDRPVADAFRWYADDHARNHPRWDPDIELEQMDEGPMRLGMMLRRRNVRYEAPLEGTMEITEYVPEKVFGGVIREGGFEIPGRATFESVDVNRTRITLSTEMPESIDPDLISQRMQRSARHIKELMESDL